MSVVRSEAGTCVLSTSCQQQDTSQFEFAFDCHNSGTIERHSFGLGGFDAEEEFDTEVKCASCAKPDLAAKPVSTTSLLSSTEAPGTTTRMTSTTTTLSTTSVISSITTSTTISTTPVAPVALKAKRSRSAARLHSKTRSEMWGWSSLEPENKEEKPRVVKYGPKDCVSIWKSPESHCVMETQCEGVNIDDFEFGLICVDNMGKPVRHMFGKGSFDSKETFDSLIPCQQCLGTDEMPENVMINNEVLGLAKDIKEISGMMKTVSASIGRLNKAVFAKDEAAAKASSTTAAQVALHAQARASQRKRTRTQHLRHRAQRRVREAEAVEEEEATHEDSQQDVQRGNSAEDIADSEDMDEEAQQPPEAEADDEDASQEQSADSSESQEDAEQAEELADISETKESA